MLSIFNLSPTDESLTQFNIMHKLQRQTPNSSEMSNGNHRQRITISKVKQESLANA